MALLISEDKKDLVIICDCGCGTAAHINISHELGEDYYAYQCFMNGNFYKEQYGLFRIMKNKIRRIWAIVRNKDYFYSDVLMSCEDFKRFKEYINQF